MALPSPNTGLRRVLPKWAVPTSPRRFSDRGEIPFSRTESDIVDPLRPSRALDQFGPTQPDALSSISNAARTGLARAMRAAIDHRVHFDPVPDHPAAAVRTGGRQRLNGAFERVKSVRLAPNKNLKCLVVVVSAGFTNWHKVLLNLEMGSEAHGRARFWKFAKLTRNRAAFSAPRACIPISRGSRLPFSVEDQL